MVTVSDALREDFEELGGRPVHKITNGYDEDDFARAPSPEPATFLISYIGTVDHLRDPRTFLRAVRELCAEHSDFNQDVRIRFVGYLSGVLLQDMRDDSVLADKLSISQYVPHQEVLTLLQESYVQLLLLSSGPETRGILTGKFFEYLASGKRILALGRVGDEVDTTLRATRAGVLHDPNDRVGIKATLLDYYRAYQAGEPFAPQDIRAYSRRTLTQPTSQHFRDFNPYFYFMKDIQMVDLHQQYLSLKPDIDQAMASVIADTAFINGPPVRDFAQQLATFCEVDHLIPCANGTDALQLAMMGLDLRPGGEIIMPTFTYVAVVEVACLLGFKPVLVDVNPNTFNVDAAPIEAAITEETVAIAVVHLFGQCAPDGGDHGGRQPPRAAGD